MKKCFALVCLAGVLMSAGLKGDEAITRENGVTIVNTTTIAKMWKVTTAPCLDYYQKNK